MTCALLGAGVMGEIILAGLLRSGTSPSEVVVAERRPDRQAEIQQRYGVQVVDSTEAVRGAETVVLVVKPQDLPGVLDEVGPALAPGALVVSVAAGVETEVVESHLSGQPVVRVMPNTPAAVGEGMVAISPGAHAGPEHLERAQQVFSAVGRVVQVPERYQDAVTAISGSGPAYLMLVVEAMTDAGVLLGLPRQTATELSVQTLYGSAALLRETGEHPTVLRESVTSPAGTTAAALRRLEEYRVRAAFISAAEAARDRSQQLAQQARQR